MSAIYSFLYIPMFRIGKKIIFCFYSHYLHIHFLFSLIDKQVYHYLMFGC